jgi:hypothetical protein
MRTEFESLKQTRAASWLSLFGGTSTLICCALPALFVALGAGAAFSSLISAVPQLIWLSEHKEAVFGAAAFLLLVTGSLHWRARSLPCPSDPALAQACARTRRISVTIYAISLAFFVVGGFFAFVVPWISVQM